jgi:hypothetical protein
MSDKLTALLNGNILFVKGFEQAEGTDVLVQMVNKKFTVTQISYDMQDTVDRPRYWITFNVGLNDLSLFTVFKWDETSFTYSNKYMINDVVNYTNVDGQPDSAVITAVYVNNTDSSQYAYQLSRDPEGLYAEADLIQNKYQ